MPADLIAQLNQYITKEILKQPSRVISPTEKLLSSGLIDSFSLVDLSIFIDTTFGVHIDDTELNSDTFDSLSELASLIQKRQA